MLASKKALLQGNVIVEAPHTTTIEQGAPSSHIQPMHETILARDTSMPPLQVIPPIVPSRTSTRLKPKNVPQSSLGHVAPFIANLRGQALPRQSTTSVGPYRSMISRGIEGASTNSADNGNERLLPICALRWARCPREDGPSRNVTKQTKQTKDATRPTQRQKKTKNLIEFGCTRCNSDNRDAKLSSKNDDINHAEAPSDSTYCKGD